jgi:hypothetical protein
MKKTLNEEERAIRKRLAELVLKEIKKRDAARVANTRKEAAMPIFPISEEEDRSLDNMTVRALTENPEATRALFDQYGVFLLDDEKVMGIMDYTVMKPSSMSTVENPAADIYWPEWNPAD